MDICHVSYDRSRNEASARRPLIRHSALGLFFFFNDTATTEIYTLSLHDALPISAPRLRRRRGRRGGQVVQAPGHGDRKSTRLNSSHGSISYAVFCFTKNNT